MPEPHKSARTVLDALKKHIAEAFKVLDQAHGRSASYQAQGPGWEVKIVRSGKTYHVYAGCNHALARVDFSTERAQVWGYQLSPLDRDNNSWFIARR